MKAVNRAAVCNILKAHPKAKTKGFARAVSDYLFKLLDNPDPDDEEMKGLTDRQRRARLMELYEETFPPNIRPDLYEIDEDQKLGSSRFLMGKERDKTSSGVAFEPQARIPLRSNKTDRRMQDA